MTRVSSLDLDWPRIDLSDWQLPPIPLPEIPLPDLPGATMQWAVAIPLLAAVLGIAAVRRSSRAAAWVAIGAATLTVLVTGWQLYSLDPLSTVRDAETIGSLELGALSVPLHLTVSRLVALVALVVALVAAIVQVYARWYLWFDPRYRAFAATVSTFTSAMLLVVHSDDVLLTLVGWEVMGWCSYLLIGHLSAKDSANRAATKALLVTRVADVGMVLGLISLAAAADTTSIPGIVRHWTEPDGSVTPGAGVGLAAGMIAVIVGVAGKSAQVPFTDWLPDAMEGPTPASALIHAATMVAAGTVVLASLLPLLQASGPARVTLAVVVAVTIVGAAVLAFAQPDLKRVLAWSTVSQVGIMLGALTVVPVGAGADAAVLHLISHAWFKALLFLALGWLGVLTGATLVTSMARSTRRFRSVRRPLGIGLLSLAGVPPLVGFVSKEMVLGQAEAGGAAGIGLAATVVLAAVAASVPLTAAYAMRAWLVLDARGPTQGRRSRRRARQIDDFFTEPEIVAEAAGIEEAESAISSSARTGLAVLALLTVLGGVLVLTPLVVVPTEVDVRLLVATLLLMLAAALAVWAASRGVRSRDAAARLPVSVVLAAERGLGVGRAYEAAVVRPVLALARGVVWLDHEIIDGYVRAAATGVRGLGRLGTRTEVTRPAPALVLVLAGVVVLGFLAVVLS